MIVIKCLSFAIDGVYEYNYLKGPVWPIFKDYSYLSCHNSNLYGKQCI